MEAWTADLVGTVVVKAVQADMLVMATVAAMWVGMAVVEAPMEDTPPVEMCKAHTHLC